MKKFIEAKFSSKCAETGTSIKRSDSILYDTVTKKAYCSISTTYVDEADASSVANHIEAN